MNYTENYSLPQWEATDRVTREAVNSAMSSIDSAIAGASPWVKLVDRTVGSAQSSVSINVSGMNLAQYAALEVYITAPTSTTLTLLLNNLSSYKYSVGSTSSYLAKFSSYGTCVTGYAKLLSGDANSYVHCQYFSNSNSTLYDYYSYGEVRWPALTTLKFSTEAGGNAVVPAGTHIRIYGLK